MFDSIREAMEFYFLVRFSHQANGSDGGRSGGGNAIQFCTVC